VLFLGLGALQSPRSLRVARKSVNEDNTSAGQGPHSQKQKQYDEKRDPLDDRAFCFKKDSKALVIYPHPSLILHHLLLEEICCLEYTAACNRRGRGSIYLINLHQKYTASVAQAVDQQLKIRKCRLLQCRSITQRN
jgi:hypothetical protein